MDMESRSGLMEHNTKETGKIIEPMAKVSSPTSMEISMMENGLMTKQMDMVSTTILTEPCMRATGAMISSMEKAENPGLMGLYTKATIRLVRSTE